MLTAGARRTREAPLQLGDGDGDVGVHHDVVHLVSVLRGPGVHTSGMQLGLFGVNMGASSRPGWRDGGAAEAAGFESVWAGEHVVLPDPQAPPSPMGPQDPALDPLLALAWAAASTSTMRLATGIVILPQRNPVVLAKEVASLDVLSAGRVTLGVGVGYLEPEFRAIGADFDDRGAVTDEYLDAMAPSGTTSTRSSTAASPTSPASTRTRGRCRRPIPIVVGGHSPAAYPARRGAWSGLVRVRPSHRRPRRVARRTAPGGGTSVDGRLSSVRSRSR